MRARKGRQSSRECEEWRSERRRGRAGEECGAEQRRREGSRAQDKEKAAAKAIKASEAALETVAELTAKRLAAIAEAAKLKVGVSPPPTAPLCTPLLRVPPPL